MAAVGTVAMMAMGHLLFLAFPGWLHVPEGGVGGHADLRHAFPDQYGLLHEPLRQHWGQAGVPVEQVRLGGPLQLPEARAAEAERQTANGLRPSRRERIPH